MPVRAVMTAAPPKMSMALTMMFVRKQKKKKTCNRYSDEFSFQRGSGGPAGALKADYTLACRAEQGCKSFEDPVSLICQKKLTRWAVVPNLA